MSDYDYDDDEYYEGQESENYDDYNHIEEEEQKQTGQKIQFGKSFQTRLVRDFLFIGEIKDNIKLLQESLGISSGKALWLYQKNNYDLTQSQNPNSKQIDEIYDSPSTVQKTGDCILCCDDRNIACLSCNHEFCKDCWRKYLQAGIEQGCEFALVKKCPMDKCKQIVDIEFFKKFVSDASYKMYEKFLMQDFLSRNKKAITCPGKKCENIIQLNTYKGSLNSFEEAFFNVSCDCSYSFCSLCREEAHRPLNCDRFKQWNSLIGGKSSESIDALWIKMNTKKCPKCKVDIEKNQGCMHMTCKKCTYEFCWLCMGDWKNHVDCNKYQAVHQKEQDQIKAQSESELKRYTFFSERYLQHRKSIQFAITKKFNIEMTYDAINQKLDNVVNFEFMTEALLTIIECRRVVAYSYPLCYYIEPSKRNLVEFQQKELEGNLEKLDHLSDVKLESFYDTNQRLMNNDFFIFHRDIKQLTQTLNKYFGNMIDSLERDVPELAKKESTKGNTNQIQNKNTQQNKKGGNQKQQQQQQQQEEEEDIPSWTCDYCEHKNRIDYIFCESCYNDH